MCIAIYKPADKNISKETLEICFENNSDGAGFAYINTDHLGVRRLKIYKSMEFEPFYKQYERMTRLMPESPFLIHFRIKTHGMKDINNCHPFQVDNQCVFIHNGTISGVGSDIKKSDTRLFNEKVLKELPQGWQFRPALKILIEDFIGMSKLVILNLDGEVSIMNESKGSWSEGIWWSNDSFRRKKTYNFQSTNYAYKGKHQVWNPNEGWKDYREVDKPSRYTETVDDTKAIVKVPGLIQGNTWSCCDSCDEPFTLYALKTYKVDTEYLSLCKKCNKTELFAGTVSLSEFVTLKGVLEHLNGVKTNEPGSDLEQFGFTEEGVYVGSEGAFC